MKMTEKEISQGNTLISEFMETKYYPGSKEDEETLTLSFTVKIGKFETYDDCKKAIEQRWEPKNSIAPIRKVDDYFTNFDNLKKAIEKIKKDKYVFGTTIVA